jgi:endogenous inhibitor of DNA gyrase (YacG/DUF329 family)
MTKYIQMKCAICGDEWELTEKQFEYEPFKICLNCRFINMNEPAHFKVPKERLVPYFLRERKGIIVSEEEMRRLYNEYYQQIDILHRELKNHYLE